MRRVVLHMGFPKTGTSAVQSWLAGNRDWLGARGVQYPGRKGADDWGGPVELRIGNGAPLHRYLGAEATEDPEAADRVLTRVLAEVRSADVDTLVYSNERLLGTHRPERLVLLRDALADTGVALHAIAYVRDIAAFAVSAYAQLVQSRLMTATLSDWIAARGFRPRLRLSLESVVGVLGREQVAVRHFDSHRSHIVADFLGVLGIEDEPPPTSDEQTKKNRTLTLREIEWKRYLNARITTRQQSWWLGSTLAGLAPADDDQRLGLTTADVAALQSFDDQVMWVNAAFFDGRPVLSVQGDLTCVDQPQQPLPLTADERRLLDYLAAVAVAGRQLKGARASV